MRVNRDFWRVRAPFRSSIGGRRLFALALGGVALAACASLALAQSSDQQIRCLQLQQELASASQGGGANSDDLARIDKQIAQYDRVFQGTQASMQDAGCFESFFIFGKALVRSPQCLNMNDRVEDARRQLTQLQQQREALTGESWKYHHDGSYTRLEAAFIPQSGTRMAASTVEARIPACQ